MQAFKLLRVRRDGSLGSLFINRKAKLETNKWLMAESHPTKGYEYRPWWHATSRPIAPHLKISNGRAWFRVEIKGVREFKRPKAQGGLWYLARHIKIIRRINEKKRRVRVE